MIQSSRPILSIIGAGSIGASLGRLWTESGVFDIGAVQNQSIASSRIAVEAIGGGTPVNPADPLPRSDVICIATADDAISPVAERLASTALPLTGKSIVFHCSGVLSSNALAPLRKKPGVLLASAHPAVSWSQRGMRPRPHQSPLCALEGDEEAIESLSEAFTRIGFRPFALSAEAKARYHAALAMASNYTVTLSTVAAELLASCDLPPETTLELIRGLLGSTIDNLSRLPPQEALTGPLVRGDLTTIAHHLAALAPSPRILEVYKTLGIATLHLATQRHPEREPLYQAARQLLSNSPEIQLERALSIKNLK